MPVRDFALDENGDRKVIRGDWALSGSTPTMTTSAAKAADQAAVAQSIKISVRMFFSEYWLDESIGVRWREDILVKNPNKLVVRELIRRAIARVPDVVDVIGGDLVLVADRSYRVDYEVRTTYGAVDGTVEIETP